MAERGSKAGGGGVGFFGLLAVLFIGLKLGNIINWSWWWVLAPLWAPPAILFAVAGIMFAIVGICEVITKATSR